MAFIVAGQDYNYVHFDTRDGLAGATVYDMCQDKDGFIWFATENGVSRFDGTHFTTYTVKDGLADNETLKVFADSKGRVWFGSLSKEVCYYYKGRIYNKENTPFLDDPKLRINAFNFCEDRDGTVAVCDFVNIVEIGKHDSLFETRDLPIFKAFKISRLLISENYFGRGFLIYSINDVYKYIDRKLQHFYHLNPPPGKEIGLKSLPEGGAIFIKSPASILGETRDSEIDIYISTVDGAWTIDTVNNKLDEHFLPGKKVSETINDKEGNIWFSTLGEGVYKLPSRQMKTFQFETVIDKTNREVFTIANHQHETIVGLGFSKFAVVKENKLKQIVDYSTKLKTSANALATNRCYRSLVGTDGNLYLGFDGFLVKIQQGRTTFSDIVSIKAISESDDRHLLIGNYAFAFKVRKEDLQITDTLWRGRCTDVVYSNGAYYFGTMDGAFTVRANKQTFFLGDIHPALQRRIVRIVKGRTGKLYVATADKGLVVISGDKVEYVFNDRNGISSNICKSLYVDDDFLWLGTSKGLNKISISNPKQIVKYSMSDGLPSDIINDVSVHDSIIWVATPKGLTYFDENKMAVVSNCNLVLLNVDHNGEKLSGGSYKLSYKENRIAFNFAAISHKSSGGIDYYYKLSGIDSNYLKTDQSQISFLSLPPGDYHLRFYAVNKFGKKSKPVEVDVFVTRPIWTNWWFYVLVLGIVSGVTTWLVVRLNRVNRAKLERKNLLVRQLANLEQQALQAQMNPHFIFNCLNSIQQYLLTNDTQKAKQYLNEFAELIRQTLSISTSPGICIRDEVAYLNKYLEMEKMRFGEKIDFNISVEPELLKENVQIPSLLIQPYVENSLRHGIRYKENGIGKVEVVISRNADMIHCRIIDNGIGRKKAAEFKGFQHIEYQSKGTQLTAKRIRLINIINSSELSSETIDLYDELDNPTGTEVIVKLPMFSSVGPN